MSRTEADFKYVIDQKDHLESRGKQGIEKNRKGDFKIKVTDKNDNPLKSAKS